MDPYREAVFGVVDPDLREELERAEAEYRRALEDAAAASGRALEWLREGKMDRPFEVLEFELEREHAALLAYHRGKFAKRVRWVLEAWKDRTC
jgi:hypothetical protein